MGYWDLNPQPLEHESPLITTKPVFPPMLTKMLKQKLMWLLFVFFGKIGLLFIPTSGAYKVKQFLCVIYSPTFVIYRIFPN